MSVRAWLIPGLLAAVVAGIVPARGQVKIGNGDTAPAAVEVVQPKGEFARKLHGLQVPAGKGWKTVTDRGKQVQFLVPEKWKVDPAPENGLTVMAVPPGSEREVKAAFIAYVRAPADGEPLGVDEGLAGNYVYAEAERPELKKFDFKPTDSGMVVLRDQRYALAGGTMKDRPVKKGAVTIRKIELLFFAEDRVTSFQFQAPASDFSRYEADVARIFASCQNINFKPLQ